MGCCPALPGPQLSVPREQLLQEACCRWSEGLQGTRKKLKSTPCRTSASSTQGPLLFPNWDPITFISTLFYWLILGKEQCSEFMKCCLSLLRSPELGCRERGGYITFISLPHEHFIKQMYVTHRVLGMKPLSSNTFKLLCQ